MAVLSSLHVPWTAKSSAARRALNRLKVPAALKNLASMPLTVAGLAAFDWGVFTVSTTAGLMTGGLLLVALEWLIADGD